jgi:hypothetical protein
MSDEQVVEAAPVEETQAPVEGAPETENLEAATEATPEVAPEVPQTEEDKRFAAKFAALTRKEKAIRESEKRLNSRMKELEAKLAAQVPEAPKPVEEPLERRLRKNPFETLKGQGLDYETLTKIALNDGKLTPELQMQIMREEIESKYSSQLEEVNKKLAAREQREEQEKQAATINGFKAQIANQVKAEAGEYELVAAEGEDGIEAIYAVIDGHYQETGEVLDIKEAVEAVEEELLEQAKKRIGLAKIKKLMGASEIKTQEVKPQSTKKPAPTLSNNAAQVQSGTGRFLSDDESKLEAAKLIKFNA